MKLRFDHQSLRLRVRRSDLEKLKTNHTIEETVQFPQGTLCYRLSVDPQATGVSASVSAQEILVVVPEQQALAWMNSDEVGIYEQLAVGTETLKIILEKDFPCRHVDTDDLADTFTELAPQ